MNQQTQQYFRKLTHAYSQKAGNISQLRVKDKELKIIREIQDQVQQTKHQKNKIKQMKVNALSSSIYQGKNDLRDKIIKLNQEMKKISTQRIQSQPKIDTSKTKLQELQTKIDAQQKLKQQHQQKLLNVASNLQRLKIQKQISASIRRNQELHRQISEVQQQQAKAKQIQEKKEMQQKNRKSLIIHRLLILQEHKKKRQEILSTKSLPIIPRYKLMEKKFLVEELRSQIIKKVEANKQKTEKLNNYLQCMHQYNSKLSKSTSLKTSEHTKRINTEIINEKNSLKEKMKKRKQMIDLFEEKRKQTKIKVSKQKQFEMALQKDKLDHPKKYNFLKLKNLTQEEIFSQFKQFELNFDQKTLGDQYLQQSKFKVKKYHQQNPQHQKDIKLKSSVKNHSKRHKTETAQKSQKIINAQKDCQNAKRHNPAAVGLPKINQFQNILKESESKSKVIELLTNQCQKNHKKLTANLSQLSQQKHYQQFLKIQSNMDSDYLQFLRAKIVSLQVQMLS